MRHETIQSVRRRVNALGQLVLCEPYRWDPSVAGLSLDQLRDAACGRPVRGYTWIHNSYRAACARDELDRRMPRTASLCFDVKTGWIPLTQP